MNPVFLSHLDASRIGYGAMIEMCGEHNILLGMRLTFSKTLTDKELVKLSTKCSGTYIGYEDIKFGM